jgi:hypothetical protein
MSIDQHTTSPGWIRATAGRAQRFEKIRDFRQVTTSSFTALLAEALEAIAAVEQLDAVETADRWFHDQPTPDVPGPAADPG